MIADAEALGADIEKLEKLDRFEREALSAPGATTAVADHGKATDRSAAIAEARAKVFGAYLRGGASAAEAEMNSPEVRALQADSDTVGGYTVAPPQWVGQLIKGVDDLLFFRQKATVIPVTSSDEIVAPSLDADPANPAWTAEIGTVDEDSTMAFGRRSLKPYQLTKLIKVSKKLLAVSALPVESLVRDRLAYKFARTEENAYLNGSGAAQPLGVFTASDLGVSTGRDMSTGNSATAIAADNIKNNKYNLKSQHWAGAEWIFHRDAIKQLAKLKDGNGQYMWQPAISAGAPDMLEGFPVNASELAPSTFSASQYVGILGNFKAGYWIAELQAMNLQRLVELYAANGQVGFVGTRWLDGMPVLEEAFSRVKLGA
jgi:HK97 family phage major capsid protein